MGISEKDILSTLKEQRDAKTLKKDYKDKRRFQKIRAAIKKIKKRNSGK